MCESVVNAWRKKIGETSALVLWWQPNFQWACSMSPEKQREKTRTLIVHKGGVSAHHNHHWYRFVVLIISSTSVWIRINAISDPKIHQDRDPFHVINFVLSIEIVDRYKKNTPRFGFGFLLKYKNIEVTRTCILRSWTPPYR